MSFGVLPAGLLWQGCADRTNAGLCSNCCSIRNSSTDSLPNLHALPNIHASTPARSNRSCDKSDILSRHCYTNPNGDSHRCATMKSSQTSSGEKMSFPDEMCIYSYVK